MLNISLRSQLIGMCLVVTASIATLTYTSFSHYKSDQAAYGNAQNAIHRLNESHTLTAMAYDLKRTAMVFEESKSSVLVNRFERQSLALSKQIKSVGSWLATLGSSVSQRNTILALEQSLTEFDSLFNEIAAESTNPSGIDNPSSDIVFDSLYRHSDELINQTVSLYTFASQRALQQASKHKNANRQQWPQLSALLALSFLFVLSTTLIIHRKLYAPLNQSYKELISYLHRTGNKGLANKNSNQDKDEVERFIALSRRFVTFHHKTRLNIARLEKRRKKLVEENQDLQYLYENEKQKLMRQHRFVMTISHQIRTASSNILGLSSLMKQQPMSATNKESINKINISGQQLVHVIDSVMDYNKIEAGTLVINKQTFSVHSLVHDVLSYAKAHASSKDIQVNLNVSSDLPSSMIGDVERITQICTSLVSNAIKYTSHGSISIDIKGELAPASYGLAIKVADTGIGISEKTKAFLYDAQHHLTDDSVEKRGGAGLGLVISQALANKMGGKITAICNPDIGSTFTIHLRVSLPQDTPCRILDFFSLSGDAVYYKSMGYITDEYCNAYQLTQVRSMHTVLEGKTSPEIAIVDIPDFDGFVRIKTTLNLLQRDGARVGLVCSTLSAADKERLELQWAGELLYYPFTPQALHQFLHRLKHAPVETANAANDANVVEMQLHKLNGKHVLLVEDNEINQVVTGEMLSRMGVTFDIAEHGRRAVEMMERDSTRYDGVIMDVQMPVMDGLQATQLIRAHGYRSPIVGLSANGMEKDVSAAKLAGMNDYLIKPITPEVLQRSLVGVMVLHESASQTGDGIALLN